jgi:hypothetical protein
MNAMLCAQVVKLMKMRDASKDKLILFTSHEFNEFAATPARDYHLMLFLSTNLMNSNEQLAMPKTKKEVILAAQVSFYSSWSLCCTYLANDNTFDLQPCIAWLFALFAFCCICLGCDENCKFIALERLN